MSVLNEELKNLCKGDAFLEVASDCDWEKPGYECYEDFMSLEGSISDGVVIWEPYSEKSLPEIQQVMKESYDAHVSFAGRILEYQNSPTNDLPGMHAVLVKNIEHESDLKPFIFTCLTRTGDSESTETMLVFCKDPEDYISKFGTEVYSFDDDDWDEEMSGWWNGDSFVFQPSYIEVTELEASVFKLGENIKSGFGFSSLLASSKERDDILDETWVVTGRQHGKDDSTWMVQAKDKNTAEKMFISEMKSNNGYDPEVFDEEDELSHVYITGIESMVAMFRDRRI